MCRTCDIVAGMSKMIQIRNVPDDLHGELKARAAVAGVSLSDFLLAEVRRLSERPTRQELLARIAALPPVKLRSDVTRMLREDRERR
jgi:plasmid stability protein